MVEEFADVTDVLNQVKGLTELMSKYGMLFVILSIFLVLFVMIIIFIIRNNNRSNKTNMDNYQLMLNNMIAQNKELLNELKEETKMVEESIPKPHSPDLVSTYIDINLALKNICKSILNKIRCDRMSIYVFHNGNNSLHGLPFFKMSCIGEWSNRGGIINKGKIHSDLPLHIFSSMIEKLYNDSEYFVSNIWDLDTHHNISMDIKEEMQSFANNSRIKGIGIYSIKDSNGNLAGFSITEFIDRDRYTEEEQIEFSEIISEQNKTIGGIIIDSNIKNKFTA